jgi:hypothetical protein
VLVKYYHAKHCSTIIIRHLIVFSTVQLQDRCLNFSLCLLRLTQSVFKKRSNFCTSVIKTLFYNILSTVPFKVVPSTGNIPFLTFLTLLKCFLERTSCDGAQFSYRIFLNFRVFKKRPNFLNSAPSVLVGELFKKFFLFLNTGV